jgi:hypothetical protein
MTELLEQAIAKLKTRPISEQDSLVENLPSAIAALILEELHADEDLGFSAVGVGVACRRHSLSPGESISGVLETSNSRKHPTTQSVMGEQ